VPQLFGWVPNPAESEAFIASLPRPVFAQAAPSLVGTGEGANVFLWECERKVIGRVLPAWSQVIGSCVSMGWGRFAQDMILANIAIRNAPEEWRAEVATEPIYAGSRVEIGRGELGNQDGSLGAWAAKWVKEYGILFRMQYGSIDLRVLNENLAKSWGARGKGVPDELEPIARQRPIVEVTLVQNYQSVRDAGANGYDTPICSMQGFTTVRDSNGFCKPTGTWAHCMVGRGCCVVKGNRPAIPIQQSWGESPTGPNRVTLESGAEIELPMGVFLVDAEVIDKMVRQRDSFTGAGLKGFERRIVPSPHYLG
jgi:hypothetical protein